MPFKKVTADRYSEDFSDVEKLLDQGYDVVGTHVEGQYLEVYLVGMLSGTVEQWQQGPGGPLVPPTESEDSQLEPEQYAEDDAGNTVETTPPEEPEQPEELEEEPQTETQPAISDNLEPVPSEQDQLFGTTDPEATGLEGELKEGDEPAPEPPSEDDPMAGPALVGTTDQTEPEVAPGDPANVADSANYDGPHAAILSQQGYTSISQVQELDRASLIALDDIGKVRAQDILDYLSMTQ